MRPILFAAALMTMVATVALAASLTANDQRYLEDQYALAPDSALIEGLSTSDQAKLHDLIDDPALKAYPVTRDNNVADFLFDAEMKACNVWALSHNGPQQCPPVADASAEPGKEIADRQCNACHLFGTADAPSFLKLAREGKLTDQALADTLAHNHAMSPINLPPAQISELMVYIRSLK